MAEGVDEGVLILVGLGLGLGFFALLAFLSLNRPQQEAMPRTEAVTLERDGAGRIVGVISHR